MYLGTMKRYVMPPLARAVEPFGGSLRARPKAKPPPASLGGVALSSGFHRKKAWARGVAAQGWKRQGQKGHLADTTSDTGLGDPSSRRVGTKHL